MHATLEATTGPAELPVTRETTRLGRARRALRRLGPAGFVRLCAYNLKLLATGRAGVHDYVYDDSWDRTHGFDTAGTVDVADIAAPDARKQGAVRYEPTPPDCFAFLIAGAGITDPSAYTFVNLGSGKGRVALLAAQAGFRQAVGVELGADLHAIAHENLRRSGLKNLALVQADARTYAWDSSPTVCFLNNPFSADILDAVLVSIEAAQPGDFRLLYYHANHADRIERRAGWTALARGCWQDPSHHYSIYRWLGPAASSARDCGPLIRV